ncbi:zinc ribbon domain-containing protein [Lactiplantibacillus daowaiensis]|uniref:Zinc ribbon domain-containing protein n=1 Tax=Lactiplantibacillus daowaiensis TaxID=2559918 RepID=A0ABW1RWE4_9LACO|nr:zinc ribbon domain-containing protein [Lactiplantibacillus daowaiensis]
MKNTQKRYRAADDPSGGAAFCPNCGEKVAAGDEFCGHCGYNLAQFNATNHDDGAADSAPTSQPASVSAPQADATQPTPTRRAAHQSPAPKPAGGHQGETMPKWAWWVIGVIVVILVGGYVAGRNYYTRSAQLNRAITALKTDKSGVAGYFSTSDPNLKLSDRKLKPLVTYFKKNPQALATFKRELNNGQTNDQLFTTQLAGKAWLLFDKYTIHVKPVYATATTNRNGAKISVNGKTVATSNSTSYRKKLGPLVPGVYTIASTGTVSGKSMTNSGSYTLKRNNQTIDLALRTISFTVQTAPKTTIYINNKKQGTADSTGELTVSELPWSGNLEVTGVYKHGSSTVTSEAYKVTSDGESVQLQFAGVMSLDDADTYMDNLFSAIQDMSNSGDVSDAVDPDDRSLDDYYTDGTDNPQYKEMVRMAKGYYNDDDLTGIEYDAEVRSVAPISKNKSIITYYLTYRFATDSGTHVQEFSYDAETEKQSDTYRIIKVTGGQKIRDTHEDD